MAASTLPPFSVYLMPLLIRLSSSSFTRLRGTATMADRPDTDRLTPPSLAAGASRSAVSLATSSTSVRSLHWSMATDSNSESFKMSLMRSMSRSTSTPIMVMKRF